MGVAGSGKSTVARALAQRLGWAFVDADDHHPATNVAKMARGEPLTEADRRPWLTAMAELLRRRLAGGESIVLACSALTGQSRLLLELEGAPIVWLELDAASLRRRLAARQGHFFPPSLLASQLATLEPPADAIRIDASLPVDAIIEAICGATGRRPPE